jgi:hypothetical protein
MVTADVVRRSPVSRKLSDVEIHEILKRLPDLPGSAVVQPEVAAAHDGVSVQTVRRRYSRTMLSPNRYGIRVDFLRQQHRYQPA